MTLKPNPGWRGDPTFLPALLDLWGVDYTHLPGWDQWGMGDFDRIQGVMWHHTGARNTSAQYIARNTGLGGALSSQFHTAPNGKQTLCGVGIAYHAGAGSYPGWRTDMANWDCIGFEMQHNGTDPWPEVQLESTRLATAAILWFLGKRATTLTMLSHWEYSLARQGKWDPGSGKGFAPRWANDKAAMMDMNAERAKVNWLIDNPPFLQTPDPAQEGNIVKQIIDMVAYIFGQLRPWPQLGQNSSGQPLTLVDAVAALRQDVARLQQTINDIKEVPRG